MIEAGFPRLTQDVDLMKSACGIGYADAICSCANCSRLRVFKSRKHTSRRRPASAPGSGESWAAECGKAIASASPGDPRTLRGKTGFKTVPKDLLQGIFVRKPPVQNKMSWRHQT